MKLKLKLKQKNNFGTINWYHITQKEYDKYIKIDNSLKFGTLQISSDFSLMYLKDTNYVNVLIIENLAEEDNVLAVMRGVIHSWLNVSLCSFMSLYLIKDPSTAQKLVIQYLSRVFVKFFNIKKKHLPRELR